MLNNIGDDNYYLDLFGKEGKYSYFGATDGDKEYNHLHGQPIYKYKKEGWMAIHVRTWVLNSKLTGDPVEV